MKLFSTKSLIAILVIGVIVVSSFVLFNAQITSFLNTILNNPTNPSNNNNRIGDKLTNETGIPLTSPETILNGGQQYADFSFAANNNPSNNTLTQMHFVGTVTNYTASAAPSASNFITLNFYTSITSCDLHGLNYAQASQYVNESQSITAGDINGAGKDEYIVAYGIGCGNQYDSRLTVLAWNNKTNNFYQWAPNISLSLYYPSVIALYAKGPQAIMQIVVAGFATPNATAITLKMIDYAPAGVSIPVSDSSHVKVTTFTLSNPGLPVMAHSLILERGDIFGNGTQELLIYGNTWQTQNFALLYQYNTTTNQFVKLEQWVDADLGRPIFTPFLDTTAEQVVIPKRDPPRTIDTNGCPANPLPNLNYTGESGFIYAYNATSNNMSKVIYLSETTGIVGAGNIEGIGQTSIILLHINNPAYQSSGDCQGQYGTGLGEFDAYIYTYNSSYPYTLYANITTRTYQQYPTDGSAKGQAIWDYISPGVSDNLTYVYYNERILSGDVNYDGITDFVLPSEGPGGYNPWGQLFTSLPYYPYYMSQPASSRSTTTNLPQDASWPIYEWPNMLAAGQIQTSTNATFGNFFGDAMSMVYKNQTWDSPGNPTILAVIAAPPTVGNISQDYADSFTSFGLSSSSSSSTGSIMGWHVGTTVTVGFEHTVNAPIIGIQIAKFSVEAKASFEYQFQHTHRETQSVSYSTEWFTGNTGDGVIFASTMYRHWNYTLVDPLNANLTGRTVTISSPIDVSIAKIDVNAFDHTYPGYDLWKTFNHTLGNPATYPDPTQIPTITQGSNFVYTFQNGLSAVGEGSGYTTQTIDLNQEISDGYEHTYNVGGSVSASATVADVTVGIEVSGGYSWGSSSEVTLQNGTKYYAQVGNILNLSQWQTDHYSFELFAYVLHRSDLNISYQVINYAIGDLGPGLAYKQHSPQYSDQTSTLKIVTLNIDKSTFRSSNNIIYDRIY